MSGTVQPEKVLIDCLNMLKQGELTLFQWYVTLYERNGSRCIPKSQLENASREETVDKLVQVYGGDGAVEVTVDTLLRMHHNNIATKLIQEKAEMTVDPCLNKPTSTCATQTEENPIHQCVEPPFNESLFITSETQSESVEPPLEEPSSSPVCETLTDSKQACKDLLCPICMEIFSDPVVLECGHSFCQNCMHHYSKTQERLKCPVCRNAIFGVEFKVNYALKNLSDDYRLMYKAEQSSGLRSISSESNSKPAKNVEEKKQDFEKVQRYYGSLIEKNQRKSCDAEKVIKKEIQKLYTFLDREKEARVSALKDDKNQCIRKMELLMELSRDTFSLSDSVKEMENLGIDSSFIQAYNTKLQSLQNTLSDPGLLPHASVDVDKHVENLKFKVWEKMFDVIKHDMIRGLVAGTIQLHPENQKVTINTKAETKGSATGKRQSKINPQVFAGRHLP